jgi:hypothetical protein
MTTWEATAHQRRVAVLEDRHRERRPVVETREHPDVARLQTSSHTVVNLRLITDNNERFGDCGAYHLR